MNLQALYRILDDWQSRPFDWPTANCCTFVGQVLREVHGIEIDFPEFADESQAARWLHDQGERSLYHYLIKTFGEGSAPLMAGRGQIVYRKGQGLSGASVGIVDRRALFVGENGLVQVPLGECDKAFDPRGYSG